MDVVFTIDQGEHIYNYRYLPGHGDFLRLQRHSEIAEISVHYHNIKGGEIGDMRSILVRVY
jgi:hypothetical protein